MRRYGFPYPSKPQTELQYYHARFPPADQQVLFDKLMREKPLTDEQHDVFDRVIEAVLSMEAYDTSKIFLLLASAGCGKTETCFKIAAYCRSIGYDTHICASTAIAALNYFHDGTTAHSLFGVPVIEDFERDLNDEPLVCSLSDER